MSSLMADLFIGTCSLPLGQRKVYLPPQAVAKRHLQMGDVVLLYLLLFLAKEVVEVLAEVAQGAINNSAKLSLDLIDVAFFLRQNTRAAVRNAAAQTSDHGFIFQPAARPAGRTGVSSGDSRGFMFSSNRSRPGEQ